MRVVAETVPTPSAVQARAAIFKADRFIRNPFLVVSVRVPRIEA